MLAALLSFAASAQDETAATREVRTALNREGQVRVIVEMALPETQSARGRERGLAASDETVAARVERNRAAVADRVNAMRGELASANVRMERGFEHLPMFTATIDAARLERLQRMPGVKQVYLDKPLARRSAQNEESPRKVNPEWPLPGIVLEKVAVNDVAAAAVAGDAASETAARTKAAQSSEEASDDPAKALLSSTVTYINADDAWARGFTGRNTSIAILDDGIDRNHDMFVGKIVAEACYSTRVRSDDVALCPGGATSSTATGAASNCSAGATVCSHGSHVAGIAAGNDTIGSVTLRGVAYEANLIPIQVFTLVNNQSDCDNAAPCLLAYSSAILNGLNYAISQASARSLAAVNLSLGGEPVSGNCDSDVRKTAIDTLRGLGVLTTIAAGNDGEVGRITPPACISTAIAVSSVIITVPDSGVNHAANVDVLAPGVLVRSANLNNTYATRSGTSMAAPHAAGAVAILKSARPTATASEIETALKTGGIATSLSTWTWTTPRIDVNLSLDILGAGGGVTGVAVPGVFGSKNPGATSFLRFFNADAAAATMTVRIYDDLTGAQVGAWTRQVTGLSSPQVNMATIEAEAVPPISGQASASQFYTLFVDAPFTGYAQHVLYSPQTNLLSNVSGCDNGLSDSGRFINNTHTTLIAGYPSFLLVHNTGNSDARPSFDVRDSRNGAQIGTFSTSANIKAHSSALINVSDVLQTLGRTPDSSQYHLNMIMSQTGFTGFAQHLVQNTAQGILTNITAKCDI
jgi:subtilisin family serine protease